MHCWYIDVMIIIPIYHDNTTVDFYNLLYFIINLKFIFLYVVLGIFKLIDYKTEEKL
jgi:hypothetical protein